MSVEEIAARIRTRDLAPVFVTVLLCATIIELALVRSQRSDIAMLDLAMIGIVKRIPSTTTARFESMRSRKVIGHPAQIERRAAAGLHGDTVGMLNSHSMRIRSFAGMVPPALVPTLRNYFVSQGITPSAIDDQGNIDPQAILALAYKEVEIRTRLTPPITYDLTNTDTRASTRALLQTVQPAIIGVDRQGVRTVLLAPYGVPSGIAPQAASAGTSLGIGVGAALLGLLALGAVIGPKLLK